MKKYFGKLWTFLADFSGVIGTLVLAKIWIFAVISKLSFNLINILLTVVVCLFTLALIVRFIKSWLVVAKNSYKEHKTQQEIKEYENKTNIVPFKDILPSNDLLQRLLEQGKANADAWTDDARLVGISLFLERSVDKVRLQMQFYFVSDWKKEALTTYAGDLTTEKYDDEEIYSVVKDASPKVFFLLYPNWSKAVIKAHSLIADKVTDYMRIQLGEDRDNSMHIIFRYQAGKVNAAERFTFNGKVLTHLKTNQAINV